MSDIARQSLVRTEASTPPRWIRLSILASVSIFMLALLGSAIVIPSLRLLHLLQALIYVAILLHLFTTGAGLFWAFIRTGQVSRPDTLMVFIASLAHFLLIISCMAGFLLQRPGRRQWVQFVSGGLLVIAYMALIIFLAEPR